MLIPKCMLIIRLNKQANCDMGKSMMRPCLKRKLNIVDK